VGAKASIWSTTLISLSSVHIDAITFVSSARFVNPSRAVPAVVKPAVGDSQNATKYVVHANAVSNYQFSVFTSVLAVTSSNLLDPAPNGLFRQIRGIMCIQEWERFCAFFCMVFRERELHAQIYEDSISISTRAKSKDGGLSQLPLIT
jgi:hypothetical protein